MSQLKTVPITIGDIEFQTTQFPAMKALEVMVMLQNMSATNNVPSTASLTQATPQLMASMTPQGVRQLVLGLLQSTQAILRVPVARIVTLDKQETIDLVFSGKLKMLFDVMAHAIEVNFGDFSEGSESPAPLNPTPGQ